MAPHKANRIDARLARMYGGTTFGVRMWLAYFPGENDSILARTLAARTERGDYPLAGLRPCSNSYYERKGLTYRQREAREVVARMERGEKLEMLIRRQA